MINENREYEEGMHGMVRSLIMNVTMKCSKLHELSVTLLCVCFEGTLIKFKFLKL